MENWCRVVYADDDETFRGIVADLLREGGVEVHACATGEDAVAICSTIRPDVALLDLDMPGWDGFQAARQLRQDSATAHLRIVAITGNPMSWQVRRQALEAGFDELLVKPLSTETLFTALRS
jgi:two-component system cell cycle response regulator DivK